MAMHFWWVGGESEGIGRKEERWGRGWKGEGNLDSCMLWSSQALAEISGLLLSVIGQRVSTESGIVG